MKLTDTQLRALRWIEENEQTCSEWLNSKLKEPKSLDDWTCFRVSGPTGSIIITAADQEAIRPFIEVVAQKNRFYRANAKGLKALRLPARAAA